MLTSLQNSLIKEIRKLHQSKKRTETGLVLLEGSRLIETACQLNCSLETICYTEDWKEKNLATWRKLTLIAQRIESVSPEVLKSLATTVNPDGIIATALRTQITPPAPDNLRLGIVLEGIQDPGNLGTIMRTALATGVDCLFLSSNTVSIDQPKVLRASVGACFHLPCQTYNHILDIINFYKDQELQIIATLPNTDKLYWNVNLTLPSLILLGNEGAGLSSSLIELANHRIKIPLSPVVESLNVATTCSVILYERLRQINLHD
jgi:TrmH family RNA methyltransferase